MAVFDRGRLLLWLELAWLALGLRNEVDLNVIVVSGIGLVLHLTGYKSVRSTQLGNPLWPVIGLEPSEDMHGVTKYTCTRPLQLLDK
jgi:hypothetical protein